MNNKKQKSGFLNLNISDSRKAQGLSMNTIIIAALALIVLIVLVFVFSGKIRDFTGTSNKCESLGGTCESSCDPDTEADRGQMPPCDDHCCIKVIDLGS